MIILRLNFIFGFILLTYHGFSQDSLLIKPKKLEYRQDGIYCERLLMYATDLGKRTNNSEILKMTQDIRYYIRQQNGFKIAAIATGIICCGSIVYAVSQPLTTTWPVTMFGVGLFSFPLTITFGVASLINNSKRQSESKKLTELYNNKVLN